eukprot:GHVP01043567.1.p2 GENE.GHVP01043567.1~~GHVP01043567.1.p2  ORF type:complete len:110 (-),score=8.80 GHVP01043567.1:165-494(-)
MCLDGGELGAGAHGRYMARFQYETPQCADATLPGGAVRLHRAVPTGRYPGGPFGHGVHWLVRHARVNDLWTPPGTPPGYPDCGRGVDRCPGGPGDHGVSQLPPEPGRLA